MTQELNNSRFNMWRAVVAMAHADGVVTLPELSFINEYLKEINLSSSQREVIGEDLRNAQDIIVLFSQITEQQDQVDFFALARALSWSDGDFDAQEKKIIKRLEGQMLDKWEVIEESRIICQEVELCDNQWSFKTERSKNLFGFLNNLTKMQSG
jgi:uncharacterized membrane protein YebE (DUF533 family)